MKQLKKLIIAAIVAVFTIPASAKDLFPILSENEDLDIVFVSKAMISNSEVSRNLLDSSIYYWRHYDIDDLYYYSSNTQEGCQAILDALDKYLAENKGVQVIMKRRSSKGQETMYGIPSKENKDGYSAIILLSTSKATFDVSMFVITGDLSIHGEGQGE